jgi:hypothetical protein
MRKKRGTCPGKGTFPGKIIMCSSEHEMSGRRPEMWIKLTERRRRL